jgi:hypothetical protein
MRSSAGSGNSLQTFRDNLSVPSSRIKNPRRMGPTDCSETSVRVKDQKRMGLTDCPETSVMVENPRRMGPTDCTKTSVRYNHYTLRNSAEKRKFSSTSRRKPEGTLPFRIILQSSGLLHRVFW